MKKPVGPAMPSIGTIDKVCQGGGRAGPSVVKMGRRPGAV